MSRCVPAEGAILASISKGVSVASKIVGSSRSDDVRVKLMADGGRLSEIVGSDGIGESLDGKEECKSICLAVIPDSKDCISRR